jgi:hypothetical protein
MRILVRASAVAISLALLSAVDAFAKEPKPAWIIGMSWGLSCGKEHDVPKGKKCFTSEACERCCERKLDSCIRQYPKKREKCEDAFHGCRVTVSNPDLHTRPGPDDPFGIEFDTRPPNTQAPLPSAPSGPTSIESELPIKLEDQMTR